MTGMAKKKRKKKSIYMEVINNESEAALKWFPRDIMPISQAFYRHWVYKWLLDHIAWIGSKIKVVTYES